MSTETTTCTDCGQQVRFDVIGFRGPNNVCPKGTSMFPGHRVDRDEYKVWEASA